MGLHISYQFCVHYLIMIEIFEMIVVVCRSRGVVNAALIYYKLVFH